MLISNVFVVVLCAATIGRADGEEFKGVSVLTPIHVLVPLPVTLDDRIKNPYGLTIYNVAPVVSLALEDAYKAQYIPYDSIVVTYRDSQMSDAHGPNVAISQLVKNELDCIIGYAFVFALAPVARMSPSWDDKDSKGIPVITPIGLTGNLDDKTEYQLMTRITAPNKFPAKAVRAMFEKYGWSHHVFLFHNTRDPGQLHGECYYLMADAQRILRKKVVLEHNYFSFDENLPSRKALFYKYLRQLSLISNGEFFHFNFVQCFRDSILRVLDFLLQCSPFVF